MNSKQLFASGKLNEAVRALSAELRDNPLDAQRRTFLFELLCFQGDYDRAEKHLNLLAQTNKQTELGAVLYYSALHAERLRRDMFEKREFPAPASAGRSPGGALNGTAFGSFEDADPRIGPRLEVFAAGAYLWIPLEHVEAIEMEAPKRLRDLLWAPALVRTGPAFRGTELGEVLLPVLSPLSWKHPDENVHLGRATEWVENNGEQVPVGQKLFLVDGEEVPLLEIRRLELHSAAAEESGGAG